VFCSRSLGRLRDAAIRFCRNARPCVVLAVCLHNNAGQNVPEGNIPTFGTTVVESSGLRGSIYFVPPGTEALPNFKHLHPVGTIYTTGLNVPPRDFREGFPGITGRFEWFAIDYIGRFFIPSRERYRFGLTSDDGSKLYIDGRSIIDNDGIHPPSGCEAKVELEGGTHSIRLSYLQGPGWQVSLRLFVAKANEPWRIFDTRNFLPPEKSSGWTDSSHGKKGVRRLSGGECWAGR
jgi:hypothetical protein